MMIGETFKFKHPVDVEELKIILSKYGRVIDIHTSDFGVKVSVQYDFKLRDKLVNIEREYRKKKVIDV